MRLPYFFKKHEKDERGVALFGVIIISLFVFTVVLSLAGTTAINTTLTATSRSNIEALAAAEAGRDTLLASLSEGQACIASGSVAASSVTPPYSWQVYRYKASGSEIPTSTTQAGVAAGCPSTDTSHVLVRVTGINRNASKTILSTYKWLPAVSGSSSSNFDSAIASGNNLTLSSFSITVPSGASYSADLTVASGNFKCEGGGTQVSGSVYVLNGSVGQLDGCGTIKGNLSVRGNINVNSTGSTRRVDGNGCATGSITNYGVGSFGGTVRQNQPVSACVGLDGDPWVEYNPSLTNPPAGWSVVKVTNMNQCRYDSNNWNNNRVHDIVDIIKGDPNSSSPGRYLAPLSSPTIIDATLCNSVQITNGVSGGFKLSTDVTIVANSFQIQDQQFSSTTSAQRMINFVTPDKTTTTPAAINCSSGQGAMNLLNNTMTSTAYSLIYSPCTNSQVTGTLRGQIYLGAFGSNVSNGSLVYIPVNAPGGAVSAGSDATPAKASVQLLSHVEL